MILLDTNILTVSKQSGHADYSKVTARLAQLILDREELVICPQNLYEFFVVATRPVANRGLGLTRKRALEEIENFKATYTLVNDAADLYDNWVQIVQQYETTGKQGHDARLVAFMQCIGIQKLYTLNVQDFNRYSDMITLLN